MYPTFNFFGREIGTYAICSIIGLFLCGLVSVTLSKKYRIGKNGKLDIFDISMIILVIAGGMFLGGHILYGLTHIREIILIFSYFPKLSWMDFFSQLGFYMGGMVYYGGFIGGCIALLIYTKFSDAISKDDALDLFALNAPLFHIFGRIGCFLGGCCYGVESEFGFVVQDNHLYPDLNGVRRLPIQLIEAFCNLIIFLVILYLFKKGIGRYKLIYVYMIIYPVCRFILEFFRGDLIRGIYFGLSTSQWISIALIIFSSFKLITIKIKDAKTKTRGI